MSTETVSLTDFSWKGYFSSTSWISGKNCYCDPAMIYFYYPATAGLTTGRSISITVPLVASSYYNYYTASYTATLYINESELSTISGSIYLTPNVKDLTLTFSDITIPLYSGNGYVKLSCHYGSTQLWTSAYTPYGSMTYTAITSCEAPSYISLTSSRLIPGTFYTVSWGAGAAGVGNSITGYTCQYRYGSNSWTTLYEGAGTSVSFSPSSAYRGYSMQFRVRTQGSAGSSWYSGYYTSGNSYLINTLPSAPSVSLSRSTVPQNGGAVTLTATAGSDSNSDTTSVYYATSTSGSRTKYSGAFSPTITSQTTYYFWTYDGYEYSSSYTAKTIYINTPPSITSLGLSYTSLSGNSSSRTYIRSISGSPTVSSDVSYYSWYIYYDSKCVLITTNKTFSLSLDSSTYYGKTIQIGLAVSDGLDTTTSWSGQFFVPYRISSASKPTVTVKRYLDGDSLDSSTSFTYFGSKIYLSWSNPSLGNDYLKTSSYFRATNTTTGSIWTSSATTATSGSTAWDLSGLVGYGQGVKIDLVRTETSTGDTQLSSATTITRAIQPTFTSSTFTIQDGVTLYPLSGRIGGSTGSLIANFSKAVCSEGDLSWALTAAFAGYTKTLSTTVATETSGLQCTIDSGTWRSAFYGTNATVAKNAGLNNKNYSVKYTITCRDKFGNTNSLTTTNRSLSYQETPTWTSTLLDSVIYYTSSITGGSLSSDSDSTYNKLLHNDEQVKITWGGYEDLNEDDNLKVVINAKNTSNTTIKSWEYAATAKSALLSLTSLSTDVNYKFSAYLKTSASVVSGEVITKGTITYCRAVNPTLTITEASIGDSVTTINLNVSDLGGSTVTSPKNLNYNRGSTSNPHADISSNFSENNYPEFELLTSPDGSTWSTGIATSSSATVASLTSTSAISLNFTFTKPTSVTFLKVRMTISTGLGGQQAVGETPVISVFPDNPTVSHRKYQVGINTNDLSTTDVLTVQGRGSEKNRIQLKGVNNTTQTAMYINLNDLKISSSDSPYITLSGSKGALANFNLTGCVIDGGTW